MENATTREPAWDAHERADVHVSRVDTDKLLQLALPREARKPPKITETKTKRNDHMRSGKRLSVVVVTELEVEVFHTGSDTNRVVLSGRAARHRQGKCN